MKEKKKKRKEQQNKRGLERCDEELREGKRRRKSKGGKERTEGDE